MNERIDTLTYLSGHCSCG